MGSETERKFLVKQELWRKPANGVRCHQGYLSHDPERTVRIRLLGDQGFLTIKGKRIIETCSEYEYEIPARDAALMLKEMCHGSLIKKTRFYVEYGGFTWEVDEFAGSNAGLILAEVEFEPGSPPQDLPEWIGEEVTLDTRYANSNLAINAYTTWT